MLTLMRWQRSLILKSTAIRADFFLGRRYNWREHRGRQHESGRLGKRQGLTFTKNSANITILAPTSLT